MICLLLKCFGYLSREYYGHAVRVYYIEMHVYRIIILYRYNVHKGRQPLMSVYYKEDVNGVAKRFSSLLFIVCSVAIQNAGKVAVATLSKSYRSKKYPYRRPKAKGLLSKASAAE